MDIIADIKARIDPIVSLTNEELSLFCAAFTKRRLPKNAYFLKEGQVCSYLGFVRSGVLVYSQTRENGDEMTIDFAFAGDWVNNNKSRLEHSPSTINIRATQDTELYVITQEALTTLYQQVPKVERLGRVLMEQAYLKLVDQTIELQVMSARERYAHLLQKHPEIFQQVQLYHIANYLGIAPKSLSRIRKEFM